MNLPECEREVDLTFIPSLCFSLPFSFFLSARFINARRRIVQPMIDQSNRAGKKNSNQKQNDPAKLHECF